MDGNDAGSVAVRHRVSQRDFAELIQPQMRRSRLWFLRSAIVAVLMQVGVVGTIFGSAPDYLPLFVMALIWGGFFWRWPIWRRRRV